jgi:O-antigen/teichoic acid export membrane protein
MLNTISNFIKNVSYNIIADFSAKLVNALLTIIISRYLGVSTMGSFSTALSYFGIGLILSYWGFGNLLTREVARDRKSYSKYFSNFAIIRLVFSVIVVAGLNILAVNLNYTEQTQQLIKIISFGIFANTLMNLIRFLFIAFEELKYLSAISLTVSVIRLITTFLVLRLTGSIITVAIFYTATEFIALFIGIAFAAHFLKEFKLQFDLKFSFQQIVRALPFFWIALMTILDSKMEIVLISFFFNEASVGYYTAMNTVISGVSLFSEGLRNAVFPIFARYQIESPEKLGKMLLILGKYVLFITVPIAIGFYFFAEPIVFLLFDSSYTLTVSLFQISIWLFIGYSLNVIVIRMLMVHNQEQKVVFSLLISGALTILLNVIFAPIWGIVAFSIIRLITVYLLFFLCYYFLTKLGYHLLTIPILIKIVFSGIAMFLITYFLTPVNPYLALAAGFIAFLGLTWLTKVIKIDDIRLWKDIIQHNIKLPNRNSPTSSGS